MTFSVGDYVTVVNDGCSYTSYNSWPYINEVPYFTDSASPVEGNTYQITFAGLHSPNNPSYDNMLYVLDGEFIISGGGLILSEKVAEDKKREYSFTIVALYKNKKFTWMDDHYHRVSKKNVNANQFNV